VSACQVGTALVQLIAFGGGRALVTAGSDAKVVRTADSPRQRDG
jgi:hypothetical protein